MAKPCENTRWGNGDGCVSTRRGVRCGDESAEGSRATAQADDEGLRVLKALPVERQPEARIIGWGDPEMMKTNFHGWRLAYRVETEKP